MSVSSRCVNKSIDCPLPTGRHVLTWSASASLSASLSLPNVQQTLAHIQKQVSTFFHWCFRSQVRNFRRFPENFVVFGWVCWELSPCSATSEPNSFIQLSKRKSSEAVGVTHILSRIWFLQFPSWWPSGNKRLGVYCKRWSRSIASVRTLILSFEQVWIDPTQCFDVSSTLVLSGRLYQDLCVLCS